MATSPQLDGVDGRSFENCHEAATLGAEELAAARRTGVADYALDAENATRLWDVSAELVGAGSPPAARSATSQ